MSIVVVNLKDSRVVFRIFIALLSFSFDSPSYIGVLRNAWTSLCLAEGKSTFGRPKYRCEGIILKRVLTYGVWGMECVRYVGRVLRTWK